MLFRQLFDPESSTYTYLLGCSERREAVLIDPVREQADRDLAMLTETGMRLTWILETHVHADHVTGARALKERTGARTAVSLHCGATGFDQLLVDGESIVFGCEVVRAIATPGHTPGSTCYLWHDRLLTGDTLLTAHPPLTIRRGLAAPYPSYTVDLAQAHASLAGFHHKVARYEHVLAGHGPPLVGGARDRVLAFLERCSIS